MDEAGCTGCLGSATSSVQPVFIPAAVIIASDRLQELTRDFLNIKRRFYPRRLPKQLGHLDHVRAVIKGREIRTHVAGRRGDVRQAVGVLDAFLALLESHHVRVVGRVWVKEIGRENSNQSLYTSSAQAICSYFHHYLETKDSLGLVVADTRRKHQNSDVSHAIFTQKFSERGDPLGRLVETPTYGSSENYVGLQLADWLCSALLFPISTYAFCLGIVESVHVSENFAVLRERFGKRLMRLQHRYRSDGRYCGGIVVADGLRGRSGSLLFNS